jgi:Conserved TM helix
VILVGGYFVAKLLKGVATKALQKLGLDRALHESDAGQHVERLSPGASPSKGVGRLVFWLAFLFVITAAIGALQIPAVTAFMNQVLAYLPNVIAAVVIFVIAAALAGAAGAAAIKLMGDTPTGKLVGAVVPTLVIVIGVFMVLNQLKIAEEIVTITFLVLLGSIGLGMALAFGLGGRQIASRLLEDAYQKGQEQRGRSGVTWSSARSAPRSRPSAARSAWRPRPPRATRRAARTGRRPLAPNQHSAKENAT